MVNNRVIEQREIPMSANRHNGGPFGRTPQINRSIPNSARRSSVFTSSSHHRPSMASAVHASTLHKDSRPIRDKSFQAECMRNVSDYLLNARYTAPITSKTLMSPTAKEFQSIFRYLISSLIDPGMSWGKKFEDDALSILKDIRYPGLDSVSKTAFTAPGAPQSWPGLLAMLNWLVELCKAHDNWNDPHCISDPILLSPSKLPVEYPLLEERLLWDFVSKTYDQWFDGGAEHFPEAEMELERIYERLSKTNIDRSSSLETYMQKKTVELQQLQVQEPPLKRLENEYLQLMSDKNKFITFIDLNRQKAEKTRQAIVKIRAAIADQGQDLANNRKELQDVEAAVATQNLTPDEVIRMNNERETLNRGLDEIRARVAEASQSSYDHEMLVTRAMDRFENLHAEYTTLAHHLSVLPLQQDDPVRSGDWIDVDMSLDLGVEDLDTLRSAGHTMRASLWQQLNLYREKCRQEGLGLEHHLIALEDQHDRLEQQVERQTEEVATLEVKLRMVHEQAEMAQSKLTEENANTNKVIAQLENEVSNMLAASQQGVVVTQSELESARIAYKELQHRTAILQDLLVSQISNHIDMIIKAKEHANDSLRSIKSLAETQ
ncbi:hypothetical protein V865_006093 [Kwoniella europaea PYCC6329]|uniref:Kinetochore protein NDC80 n=1 Tax=Kwoniella europaea PYCC6329 TaxID=1423913 RepID=A0AAX4KQM6_9TREE